MADHVPSSTAELLKRFSKEVASSSTKQRVEIIEDVTKCVTETDLPEAALKGILKFLCPTITAYSDAKSLRASLKLVDAVVKKQPKVSLKAICSLLTPFAELQKSIKNASRTSSGDALVALSWTCIALLTGFKTAECEEFLQKLVELQSLFVYGAVSSTNTSITKAAFRKLCVIWRLSPKVSEQYGGLLIKMDPSVYLPCVISLYLKYLVLSKQEDQLQAVKDTFIEIYTKLVIESRSKPPLIVLKISQDILRHCSHALFKEKLLPSSLKALLRNPEIILEAVSYLLSSLQIDLSQYGMEIIKPIGAQLISKDQVTRDEACSAVGNLALQCSDKETMEKLVKHVFGVLTGSEGKLTLAEQKISVVQAIGNLSRNSVSGTGSLHGLSTSVAELFLPVLSTEVHEGTLTQSLSVLSQWAAKFYTSVPDKLLQWFKKGMTLKSATSPVRNAYILCMNASFHGDTLTQAVDMVPLLIQSIEKAVNHSTQFAVVTEAISAGNLLLRLSAKDITTESKLGPFWNAALDSDKKLFVNEKYMSSVSSAALEGVVSLAVKLILEFPQKLTEKMTRPYYRAIVYCLTRKEYSIRKFTQRHVKQMLSVLGGTAFSICLLEEFDELLKTQKMIDLDALNMEDNEKESMLEQMKYVSPRILSQSLIAMTTVQKAERRDAESIAKATLIIAHHPCIVSYNPGTWTDILFGLKLDARNFIKQCADFCLDIANQETEMDESRALAVESLVRIAPDYVMKGLVDKLQELLGKDELVLITKDEYGAYLNKEGELYDKQLAESLKVQYVEDKNVRRENKLYSYKEQMAELELKKELEKKKGKPAQAAPKLSKKQEELLQAQLKKESEIRAKLTLLNGEVCKACTLLKAMVKGNPDSTGLFMKELCRLLVPLLKSPLAAPHVMNSFVDLGSAVFTDPLLGALVSYSTLRLIQPECDCQSEWFEEPKQKQLTRVINRLYRDSITVEDNAAQFNGQSDDKELFSASCFAFLYYFINYCLIGNGEAIGRNDDLMVKLLVFVEQHAQMRHDGSSFRESDPALFPLKELFYMLINVIGVSTTKIQQYANSALTEVALCAGGGEGCVRIDNTEILELLKSLKSPCTAVREATLQALLCLSNVLPNIDDNYEVGLAIAQRVWVCSFDEEKDVKELAEKLLEELNLEEPFEEMCSPLVQDLIHPEEIVRKAGAEALAKTLECHQDYITPTLSQLLELFTDKLVLPPPKLDEFGRQIAEQVQDEWQARTGIAMALGKISHILPQDQLVLLFNFYVPKGLGDRHQAVRTQIRQAALANINVHGKDNVNTLLPVFEDFLTNAPGTATYDAVRQSIVILMGSLAKHLDKDDPKVKPIVGQLITALSTPSQEVQEAVANCLPPLVPAIRSSAPDLVHRLVGLLLESENYGERKGAAYGLAGLVRGLGITALKQLEIMTTLEGAVKDKKNPRKREGALFAYEMMCTMLGKLFEPYVVHILPHLLLCFGDSSQYVREAADDTAKAVMSMLTAHGVKLVLPSLLKGLEEDSWRTKAGAVELLGSMAYCAPKQLSQCLPSIVPKITEILTDSHLRVQKAAEQALKQIGNVIKNPEIQAIVPVLLEALQEPATKINYCLQNLLATKFVHFIDAPSLALIMPVVERAFQDRATETKKMAAMIIGNMYSLTDQKDLEPYIDKVIPGLQKALLDPVPEVRSVSSRALGAMVKGIAGNKFDELMTWLMETLKSEGSSVDRSGAAQGLSEVVGGMGLDDLDKLMPTVISTTERSDIPPHVRDGYTMMYIYLPTVFKDDFMKFVGPIIPSILQALADESEFVRETALKAGQRIINMYANTAIELLLPELEKGLFDDNWRIRFSSVQLLGDLLYIVSGVSGKMSTESAGEDDNFGTENSQQLILKVLGDERRNRVLSGLYMGRSDTALLVRQAALHVWKVIVSNTPRTLREILSTLFTLLLGCLASTSHDKRQVAARTLGDLVRKLGERILPEIIPILEHGLDSDQSDQRQGVCIGLGEIMASTKKEHVQVYAESLIPTVKRALTDPLEEVREAAANTFSSLHDNIGVRALDGILPDLLSKLDEEDMSDRALDGLKQVMIVKSNTVLPYLVPQLTKPPINTRALSYLASVSGEALTRHLTKILPALMAALSEKAGTDEEEAELSYCKKVVLSVESEIGVRTIMEELMTYTQSPEAPISRASVTILHSFCENTRMDYEEYLPQLFRGLIALFTRKEPDVLLASWECLNTITKNLTEAAMLDHIQNVRQAVRYAVSDFKSEELPGFSIPKKGIAPVLPIFREGILNGPPDLKEQAAIGLGEIINRTSPEALKPSVLNITGPLIRILGDRFTFNVKVAVLETLTLLLSKVGVNLKPFLPQLQTTFAKALNDPNRLVRLKSAEALGKLITIHTRVDPLFTELHTNVKNIDDASVRDTILQALRFCLVGAGAKMSPANRKQIMATVLELLNSPEDSTRTVASGCVGVMCLCLPEEELTDLMIQHLLDSNQSLDWALRLGRSLALGVAIKEAGDIICNDKYINGIRKTILTLTDSDRIPLCVSGYRCLGYLIHYMMSTTGDVETSLFTALLKGLKHESNEVKQLIGSILSYCMSCRTSPLDLNITKLLVPPLVMGTKEKNTLVRSNCEYALVAVLQLKDGDTFYKSVMTTLDAGMRDSLQETYAKSLRKLSSQPMPVDRLDITLLT